MRVSTETLCGGWGGGWAPSNNFLIRDGCFLLDRSTSYLFYTEYVSVNMDRVYLFLDYTVLKQKGGGGGELQAINEVLSLDY